jgi:hypothetical protein
LRHAGASLGVGLVGNLAGCTGLPPLGSAVRYGAVDVPPTTTGEFPEWLAAPAALPDTDGPYDVMVHTPPGPDAPAWARSSIPRSVMVSASDYVGVHIDDVAYAVSGEDVMTLVGDVDLNAVSETVGRTSYDPAGTVEGYDLFRRPDEETVVAAGPEAVVFGLGDQASERVATTIGVHDGDVDSYHTRNRNMKRLSEAVGSRRWAWVMPGATHGPPDKSAGVRSEMVGAAFAFDHDADSIYFIENWLFPPGFDLTVGAVKESLKRRDRARDANAVDIAVDGRLATITMHLTRTRYEAEYATSPLVVPYATWRGHHDAATQQLRITHEAGDSVARDQLEIDPEGHDPRSIEPTGGHVRPGDTIRLATDAFDPGTDVRLVYHSPDGDRSATLFTHEL